MDRPSPTTEPHVVRPSRAAISRETRLLLLTVLVSVATLWVLARLRFPDRPVVANPVPPILTQFRPPPSFDDLASSVSRLASEVTPYVTSVPLTQDGAALAPRRFATALQIRDALAVALVRADERPAGARVVAHDPGSGFTVFSSPGSAVPAFASWPREPSDDARYLLAVEATAGRPSARPVFVAGLFREQNPFWPGEIWLTPPGTDLAPGDIVFTTAGELAGLVVDPHGRRAIVPAVVLLNATQELQRWQTIQFGQLGIDVQPMTPAIASGAGASTGVIVAWIDPTGPAAGRLAVLDVIEAVDGVAIENDDQWLALATRLATGQTVVLRIRRKDTLEIRLVAAPAKPGSPAPLGVSLRSLPRLELEIVRIDPGSAAERGGLLPGDIITFIGPDAARTPAQLAKAFAQATTRPLLVTVRRGTTHRVAALENR